MKKELHKPKVSLFTKASLLILLAVQNAALTLFARSSRVSAKSGGDGDGYAKTTLVVIVEALKFVVAFVLLMIDRRIRIAEAFTYLYTSTFSQPLEVLKLLVPSSLYVLQNNLVLVAADNLEGPIVAVLSQLKILTTAIFSVMILNKSLALRQWLALFALIAGVASVQISTMMGVSTEREGKGEDVILGGLAALAAAGTSGFAGVYFEMVLKGSDTSVWVRNIHLASFGVLVALFGVFSQPTDMDLVKANGFLGGYDQVVWGLVFVHALGGLLVAAVVKYTDNILKAFATSASLVAVSVISVLFFNFPAPPLFLFGTTLVVYAMFLYGDMLPSWLTGSDIFHIIRYRCFGPSNSDIMGSNRARAMSANSTLFSSPSPQAKDALSRNNSQDSDIELQKEEEKALIGT